MEKKEGKIPCNARIDIDYTGKKPKIKFGYTSKSPKKDAVRQHNIYPLFVLLLVLWIIPYLFFLMYPVVHEEYPTNCSITFNEHYLNMSLYSESDGVNITINKYKRWIDGMNITCDNETKEYMFVPSHYIYEKGNAFRQKNNFNFRATFIAMFYFFIVAPFLIVIGSRLITKWLLKQKWYVKNFPKKQAEGIIFKRKNKKYYKFKPKDVLERIIVIPSFGNIELIYNTQGDFSKYLEKIKIREYRWRKIKTNKNKISKEKVDNYKWYAIFYFKKKPKKGYLEVIYQ